MECEHSIVGAAGTRKFSAELSQSRPGGAGHTSASTLLHQAYEAHHVMAAEGNRNLYKKLGRTYGFNFLRGGRVFCLPRMALNEWTAIVSCHVILLIAPEIKLLVANRQMAIHAPPDPGFYPCDHTRTAL
jgi:hypothetical protein